MSGNITFTPGAVASSASLNTVATNATSAATAAAAAQTAATVAQNTASTAQTSANTAIANAASASSTAQTAQTTASAAQTSATTALSAAQLVHPASIPVTVISTSGSSRSIILPAAGDIAYDITLTQNCVFTVSGGVSKQLNRAILYLRANNAAIYPVTWPAGISWVGGATPTLTSALGGLDIVEISTLDGAQFFGRLIATITTISTGTGGTGTGTGTGTSGGQGLYTYPQGVNGPFGGIGDTGAGAGAQAYLYGRSLGDLFGTYTYPNPGGTDQGHTLIQTISLLASDMGVKPKTMNAFNGGLVDLNNVASTTFAYGWHNDDATITGPDGYLRPIIGLKNLVRRHKDGITLQLTMRLSPALTIVSISGRLTPGLGLVTKTSPIAWRMNSTARSCLTIMEAMPPTTPGSPLHFGMSSCCSRTGPHKPTLLQSLPSIRRSRTTTIPCNERMAGR